MDREHVVRMGSGGRFVIPAKLRRAIRSAQALVREHVSGKRRLADELIGERKREAESD